MTYKKVCKKLGRIKKKKIQGGKDFPGGHTIYPCLLHKKIGSGSTFPGSGAADLDPDQNEGDPQHWIEQYRSIPA